MRRIIDVETSLKLYGSLLKLVEKHVIILEDEDTYLMDALNISLKHDISFYDSLYIAQALKYGELVTSDEKQSETAKRMGIETYYIP